MRKFLVVVDSTPECMNALRFAARRAANTNGGVTMLYVIAPEEFQHWAGVAEVMRRERREEAEARLSALADEVRALAGVMPEFAIREGEAAEEVLAHIHENPDIGVLVLGAAEDGDGPGPLVSTLVSKRGGRMPAPVTVVPGGLSLEQIDEIT
ncbi:universal stress protein [Rubrimonas cliftonensis]|uniref:Nucleotide-binding universal stress protein, UspA family n=1 Tax=Rubrimonas cliftonensis TaxID=89524 RepID=A0A1H4DXT1_9RHOB|nr:universal stress protein [Rubrimonas cliftonensis]SEA77594.1 Nucleotide-binding universal stress protein, UspA family [Rubrimonas cliftonensis]